MATDAQETEHWKQKYFQQLDQLETKEQEWSNLEAILKKAVSRLSIAAEGQDNTLDRKVQEIKSSVRDTINQHRLENSLDELSKILTNLEEKQNLSDRQIIIALEGLLTKLELPEHCAKGLKKLQKQFNKANDDDSERLIKETVSLLGMAITADSGQAEKKPGLFSRLTSSADSDKHIDVSATAQMVSQIIAMLPWPQALGTAADHLVKTTANSDSDESLHAGIAQLDSLLKQWPKQAGGDEAVQRDDPAQVLVDRQPAIEESINAEIEVFRRCIIQLIDELNDPSQADGRLSAMRLVAKDAQQQGELNKLIVDLAQLVKSSHDDTVIQQVVSTGDSEHALPPIEELLIRLLEQLVVPADFNDQVDDMKHRLEKESEAADWRKLLKDVASLINSIRSHLQQEKHEFEDFLQQITGRLSEMDAFLKQETGSLEKAQQAGDVFDKQVKTNVADIRQDMDTASDLSELKSLVESRLDVITKHILDYRQVEQQRVQDAQQNASQMQQRMASMEQETQSLKQIVEEKNKQAMFDVLTGVPNRLSFELKVEEEIARWKRFANPLSLVIWDVDFFKKVNDTYGHKAGDKVLKTIAQLLNDRIRTTDFFARYGGEEFVMLLPGTKEEETLRLVNDLRTKVETCGFHYHGDAVTITVSCGVSSFHEGDSLGVVFERADKALYKAKKNGRNQCVVAACRSD